VKKTLDSQKNTRLQMQSNSENAQKMCCNANPRHATQCKPETKKTGDSSKWATLMYVFVCTSHWNF